MFKKFWGWKFLSKSDSTEQEIKQRCARTRQVSGHFQGNVWRLILVHINGNDMTQLLDSPARFNQTNSTVAFWLDDTKLDDFQCKWKSYDEYMRRGGDQQHAPYSWQELSDSAQCAVDFNLENINSAIAYEEEKQKASGGLSVKPTLVSYPVSYGRFQVRLKIDWRQE